MDGFKLLTVVCPICEASACAINEGVGALVERNRVAAWSGSGVAPKIEPNKLVGALTVL